MRNYVGWYRLKSTLEARELAGNFGEREIWWCSLGANIGDEEDGKNTLFERPVIIMRKYNKQLLFAIPLSSSQKDGRFYTKVASGGVESTALLSQARTISSKRLQRRLGRVTEKEYKSVWADYVGLHTTKSNPQLLGGSRAPDGDLYLNDTKHEQKSQGGIG